MLLLLSLYEVENLLLLPATATTRRVISANTWLLAYDINKTQLSPMRSRALVVTILLLVFDD